MRITAPFLAQKVAEALMKAGQGRVLHLPAGAYQTSDGWLVFSIVKQEHFARLCRAADNTELLDDPRYVDAEHRKQNAKELRGIFVDLLMTRTTDEWVERLQMNEVLSNPINTLSDSLPDAHVRASESVGLIAQPDPGPVEVPIIPGIVYYPELLAPAIGQHGCKTLKRFGLSDAELGELADSGALHLPKS